MARDQKNKYYEYKTEYVYLTEKNKKDFYGGRLATRQFVEMAKASGYSEEHFRKIIRDKQPDRLTKPVFEAISKISDSLKSSSQPSGKPKVKVSDLSKPKVVKPITSPKPKSNFTINTTPVRKPGENAIDFAARKNEWKRNQK